MYQTRQQILLAKIETTYGTDPTPVVATNAIDAENIQLNYTAEINERNIHRPDFSPVAPVTGKRTMELSFSVEIKGSGTAGTAPSFGPLLQACAFSETVTANTSVAYAPTSASIKSLTFYVYHLDGASTKLHKITGARGNVNMSFEAGMIAKMEFNFRGLLNDNADVAAPGTPAYGSVIPPIVEVSGFTLNSVTTLIVQSINFDMNNELSQLDSINSTAGIHSFRITGRAPSGSFNPEAVTNALYDFLPDWEGATQRALSLSLGSVAGNQLAIAAPKVTIDGLSQGDRNGIITNDTPFRLSRNSGNDEITLTFT